LLSLTGIQIFAVKLLLMRKKSKAEKKKKGKLRIGDTWSAISIIAQSQNNPLKAIAEFVENSIDARATEIEIYRGRSAVKLISV